MIFLRAFLLLIFSATLARAEWPTTSFLPVPAPTEMVEDIIGSDFGDFAEDTSLGTILEGLVNQGDGALIVDVTGLDFQAMRRGAIGALIDLMRLASIDAKMMESAKYPVPLIEPMIRVDSQDTFFPLFWSNLTTAAGGSVNQQFTAPAWQACKFVDVYWLSLGNLWSDRYRNIIEINSASFPYSALNTAWTGRSASSGAWERRSNDLTATVIHETVHAIERHHLFQGCQWGNPWIIEGLANAISSHLASKRVPDLYNRYPGYRDDRRYDVSLDVRQFSGSTALRYGYDTGSFWRYLMEASGETTQDQLAILKRILELPVTTVASRDDILTAVDDALKGHTNGRGLYQILPEFLTEFGSYGGTRYTKINRRISGRWRGVGLNSTYWLDRMFLGCEAFSITPSTPSRKTITVNPLAGECLRVEWSGFPYPVALQMRAVGAEENYGDLHLGEVRHATPVGVKYCYQDATKVLTNRLSRQMIEKCMLRRGTAEIDGKQVASWTSDLNLAGIGEVVYLVSNVAKDPAKTKKLTFDIIVDALNVKSISGQPVAPAKPGGEETPVTRGMTDIEKRVYTITGGGDRVLIDGRSVLGDVGTGFMENVPGGGEPGDALFTLIRSQGYAIMWVGAYPGAEFNDGVFIYQDPMRILTGDLADNLAFSGGMRGLEPDPKCGYLPMAQVELLEESEERVLFRLTADLFNPLKGLLGASGDACELADQIFVERVEFEISLPYGPIHSGGSRIKRGQPPGQEIYDDEEFPPGPFFGGILTSISLRDEGFPGPGEGWSGPAVGPQSGGGGEGGAGGASGDVLLLENCDCACPEGTAMPNLACAPVCGKQWSSCQSSTTRILSGLLAGASPAPESPEPTDEAQRKYLSRLIDDSGWPEDVEIMLMDDFSTMSSDTRKYLLGRYRDGAY